MKKKKNKKLFKNPLKGFFMHPFNKAAKKAEETLMDAGRFIEDSNKLIRIGAIVFITSMGLSILSSTISIKLGIRALKENKTKEQIMMFNLMKKLGERK